MKKIFQVLFSLVAVFACVGSMGLLDNIECLASVVDFLFGGGAMVAFAAVGATIQTPVEVGDGTNPTHVVDGEPNDNIIYDDDLEQNICKVGSNKFVLDTMTRHIKNRRDCKSWVAGGYEIGERPIEDRTSGESSTASNVVTITVTNPDMWVVGDVFNVMAADGPSLDSDGKPYSLLVTGKDASGKLTARRTDYRDSKGVKSIPTIASDSLLVRMAPAYNERVAYTDGVVQQPSRRSYYNQNFMATVEVNTLAELHKKEVNINFTTYKEQTIFDMRYAMERANLFQVGGVSVDKDNKPVYTATGAWHQIENVLEYNDKISTADWASYGRMIFSENNGSETRLLLPGADFMVMMLQNADFAKQMLEKSTELVLGVKVKRIETGFGELLVAPGAPLFRGYYSKGAMVLDLAHITRETFVPMHEKELDLETPGIARAKAVRLNEISSIYLQNLPTHFKIVPAV